MQEISQAMQQTMNTMTLLLGAIAAISLLVGGIGVMNIMLLSVGERTHEIGISKAVGATTRRILIQFFAESMTLTLFAGLGGIFVGWGLCALFNLLPKIDFFAGLIVTPQVGLVAFGFLTLRVKSVAYSLEVPNSPLKSSSERRTRSEVTISESEEKIFFMANIL
jgi:putative ABC transport system permease protein